MGIFSDAKGQGGGGGGRDGRVRVDVTQEFMFL